MDGNKYSYIEINLLDKYLDWAKLKFHVNARKKSIFPKRKEIWWASLGQNVGVEINGKNSQFERPVLVLKVFNPHSYLVAPITTNTRKGEYIYLFNSSLDEPRAVNVAQLRTISSKRFLRMLEVMSDENFDQIISTIQDFLKSGNPSLCGVSSELTIASE
jgi:mRNA interferase MazF